MFFSLDAQSSIQIVCVDNDSFRKFSKVIDSFKDIIKINIDRISIEPDVVFTKDMYMIYKPYSLPAIKIKLFKIS